MTTFIGEYSSRLDDKGRLVMPSPLKSMLPSGSDQRFVVKKDIFTDCLEMYTFEEWQRQSESVRANLSEFNSQHKLFWREYMRNSTIVVPDPKFGRISIPKKLLDSIGAKKDVIFFGNNYKIEIWAKEKYEQSELSPDEFIALADKISTQLQEG